MPKAKKGDVDAIHEPGEIVETEAGLRRDPGDRFQVHTTGWPDAGRDGWQVAATARTIAGIEGLALKVFGRAGIAGARIGKVRVHDKADASGATMAKAMLAKVRSATGGLAPKKR